MVRSIALSLVLVLFAAVVTDAPQRAGSAFPGANGKIAFHTNRSGNADVYVMDPDGSGVMRLTYSTAADEDPAWSADGQKIAFASERDGNFEIYSMNADGSGQANITDHPSYDAQASWSPDGTQLTFASNRDGNAEIYLIDADGTGVTRLTENPAYDAWPAWSPDGAQILFYSSRADPNAASCFLSCGNYEVYVLTIDGGEVTRLTDSPGFDGDPAWSPDASQIVFVSDRDTDGDIFVMNADGSGQTNISDSPANDTSPAWSADGSKIAFRSNRDGNHEVYVVGAGGGKQTNLTNNPARDTRPHWEPVLFQLGVGGVAKLPEVAGTASDMGRPAAAGLGWLASAALVVAAVCLLQRNLAAVSLLQRSRAALVLLMAVLCWTLLFAFVSPATRYHFALGPVIAILAGAFLVYAWDGALIVSNRLLVRNTNARRPPHVG